VVRYYYFIIRIIKIIPFIQRASGVKEIKKLGKDSILLFKLLNRAVVSFALCFFICLNSWSIASNNDVTFGASPGWADPFPITTDFVTPKNEIENGVYYLLVDDQVKVEDHTEYELYSHRAVKVLSAEGMEESSSFNVDFDPSYQSVKLNVIQIIRDGRMIDKTSSARISVLQREERMEALIYDERLTANVIIDDVRVGDIVEFSYTRTGRNPVYGNKLALYRYIEYSIPVQQINIAVLWGKSSVLNVKRLNTQVEVQESTQGKFKKYSIKRSNVPAIRQEQGAPKWFEQYGLVYLSEYKSWSEVVDWAVPLYENVILVNADIEEIAAAIRIETAEKQLQISKALQFVQNEVRYLGLENGTNSHVPSNVSETLARRYGDCKDKAVLFISLLKALNVEASPVLVNTNLRHTIEQALPSGSLFDHVIVKVSHNNKSYWLDPTKRFQRGNLDQLSQSDYGRGLVVKTGVTKLENMQAEHINAYGVVKDYFDLSQGPLAAAEYNNFSEYKGRLAEDLRYDLSSRGVTGTQERYIDFYKKYYSSIEHKKDIEVIDNSGEVQLRENYIIPEFWVDNSEEKGHFATFYANYISSMLVDPGTEIRQSPFYIGKRGLYEQFVEINLKETNWSFEDESLIIDNDIFKFEYNTRYNAETFVLLLEYSFELKAEFVEPNQIKEYSLAQEKAYDKTTYSIVKYYESNSSVSSENNWSAQLLIYLGVFLTISLILSIIFWKVERNNRPDFSDVKFYPISYEKFYILSILTLNLYVIYWFYKNWQYIKVKNDSNIMPFFRALFSTLWLYSLNSHLKNDSQERASENKMYSKVSAVCITILYLLISLAQNSVVLVSVLLLPLLLYKFVHYINSINIDDGKENSALVYNSAWNWRNVPFISFCLPIFIVTALSDINLMPSNEVVNGSKIWAHDLRFMQRAGVIAASDKVVYFFSNDFWTVQADGNGVTKNQVFSYWYDGGKLSVEKARFNEIKKVDVIYSDTSSSNTILTIVRNDDSEFVLYLSGDKAKDKKVVKFINSSREDSNAKGTPQDTSTFESAQGML